MGTELVTHQNDAYYIGQQGQDQSAIGLILFVFFYFKVLDLYLIPAMETVLLYLIL
jgi:hypothetical protein